MSALICEVQRFSIHDGPGIRTTVFFKGCPMACVWCHNPEAISFQNELLFTRATCIGCGECAAVCPNGAVRMGAEGPERDPALCVNCMTCVEACPSGALQRAAKEFTADGLLAEVLRDEDYYAGDGGVTLSGGEPLAQTVFLGEFLPLAKASGLHVAVQTAGLWSWKKLGAVLDAIDYFMFDLKAADPERHLNLTGRSNEIVLKNLARLVEEGKSVEVRMPVAPGCNDDEDNLLRIGGILKRVGVDRISLLPYHPLGEGKGAKLASRGPFREFRTPTSAALGQIARFFEERGILASIH